MKQVAKILLLVLVLIGCSSIRTNTEFYTPIIKDLRAGRYNAASLKIEHSKDEYSEKDRVLKYLDEGIIFHYSAQYKKSNEALSKAENAIEELFTKSISKGAASILLNDNTLAYRGEIYENLYINIVKALNYIHLNNFDDAYVEVRRINNKLKKLQAEYGKYAGELKKSEENKFEFETKNLDYFNNVLANYISHLILRAEGDEDGSRISLKKLNEAWQTYPDVYQGEKPLAIDSTSNIEDVFRLNIIAFAGNAPTKVPIGARITTLKDVIMISDPTNFYLEPIVFPGIEGGYNFKFEFPAIEEEGTLVNSIRVIIDSSFVGELQLLENICNVARKTFETQKSITYFKTIARVIAKGLGAKKIGNEIENKNDNVLGSIASILINIAADISEGADLRCWRTIPGYSFIGEYPITKGKHNITIKFIGAKGEVLQEKKYQNYNIKNRFNLIESFYLD